MHALLLFFGLTDASSTQYLFWSGVGSDISEIAIFFSLITYYKTHKCVVCFRLGHHQVQHTHYKTCHRHATIDVHKALKDRHKEKHQDMHALFTSKQK